MEETPLTLIGGWCLYYNSSHFLKFALASTPPPPNIKALCRWRKNCDGRSHDPQPMQKSMGKPSGRCHRRGRGCGRQDNKGRKKRSGGVKKGGRRLASWYSAGECPTARVLKHMGLEQNEKMVGIEAFLSGEGAARFTGILKQRFTDFIVNEICIDGEECHLVDCPGLFEPKEFVSVEEKKEKKGSDCNFEGGDDEAAAADRLGSTSEAIRIGLGRMAEDLGSDTISGLREWILSDDGRISGDFVAEYEGNFWFSWLKGALSRAVNFFMGGLRERAISYDTDSNNNNTTVAIKQHHTRKRKRTEEKKSSSYFVLHVDPSREVRTRVHSSFRQHLGEFVETSTGVRGDVVEVRLVHPHLKRRCQNEKQSQGNRRNRRDGSPRFTRFAMYKQNMDTNTALERIRGALRVSRGYIGIAGTKDKRATTTQWVTVLGCDAASIAQLNVNPSGQKLVSGSSAMAVGCFSCVDKQLQLGDLRGNRFNIVLRDVSGDIDEVCSNVAARGFVNFFGLQRFGTGGSRTHAVGTAILKGEWLNAVKEIMKPRWGEDRDTHNAKVLFLEDQQNTEGALHAMPPFMHLERSILSTLTRFGTDSAKTAIRSLPRQMQTMYLHSVQSYVWNKVASKYVLELGKTQRNTAMKGDLIIPKGSDTSAMAKPHMVTESEANEGRYLISEVVLPLPGVRTKYPDNFCGKNTYGEVLSELGLTLDHFKSLDGPEFTLGGGFRLLVALPGDMTWSVKDYTHLEQPLIPTDLDKLLQNLEQPQFECGKSTHHNDGKPLPPLSEERIKKGLCLSFTLPLGSYATVMIHEMTKQSQSVQFQTGLGGVVKRAAAS